MRRQAISAIRRFRQEDRVALLDAETRLRFLWQDEPNRIANWREFQRDHDFSYYSLFYLIRHPGESRDPTISHLDRRELDPGFRRDDGCDDLAMTIALAGAITDTARENQKRH